MLVTGIVNTSSPTTSVVGDEEVEVFTINEEYADPLRKIYHNYWRLGEDDSPDTGIIFSSIRDDVENYDALQRSLLENIGDITFGIPIVYTSEEKKLQLPKSIQRNYDVYWADLVVTYRDINIGDIVEMAFNVAVPEGSISLKLVPLRFGVEITQNQRVTTPEINIGLGGAKVGIGEFFSQSVAYKYLRPTVEASGEGERVFSWKMTGQAVSGGSHRFAAIIGVPKGMPEVDFAFSGHVRLRKSFIGEWYDGELVAGTDALVLPVSF